MKKPKLNKAELVEEKAHEKFHFAVLDRMFKDGISPYQILHEVIQFLEVEEEIQRDEYIIETGEFYGYPKCCIKEFCDNYGKPISNERSKAGDHHGFLPCQKHAELILKGKITLESLIKNRICKTPFPFNEDDIKELKQGEIIPLSTKSKKKTLKTQLELVN